MTEQTESLGQRLARGDAETIAEMRAVIEDPYLCTASAARGDVESQRKLALAAWACALKLWPTDGGGVDLAIALYLENALTFSRLAAAHGEESDVFLFCNRLMAAAELFPEGEPDLIGEALGWVQRDADAGSEDASLALNSLVARASPEAIGLAAIYRERLKAHVPNNKELN